MFDPEKIAKETVQAVMSHADWKMLQQLYFVPPQLPIEPHPARQSPLTEQITALCKVANGEVDRATADDHFVGEVYEICQSLAETLWSQPLSYHYTIPPQFWESDLGQVMMQAQAWARRDTLITISEAARMLYGESTPATNMRISRLLDKQELTRYHSADEPNPQHRARVSKAEIEELIDLEQQE